MSILKDQLQDVALCTDIFTSVLRGATFESVGHRVGLSDSRVSQIFYKVNRQMRAADARTYGQLCRHEFVPFSNEFTQQSLEGNLERPLDLWYLRSKAERLIEFFHFLLENEPLPELPNNYPDASEWHVALTLECLSCTSKFFTLNPNHRICYRCLQCARQLHAVLQAPKE